MIYFKEEQQYRQWWLWVLLLSINLVILGLVITNIHDHEDFIVALLLGAVPVFVASWLIFSSKLQVEIKDRTIYYRFTPFQTRWRKIRQDEIESYEVIQYKPIRDYGGWGIRAGFGRKKAINMYGDRGLKIHFKNGKDLLIGTQKPEAMKQTLDAMMSDKTEDYG